MSWSWVEVNVWILVWSDYDIAVVDQIHDGELTRRADGKSLHGSLRCQIRE